MPDAIDSGSKVVAHDGRMLTLGERVKSGGAGSIYRIAEAADLVAKIYHPHVDRAVYERKVEAMLTLVPDLPDIEEDGAHEVQMAWPRMLLRDPRRRFLGFAMPLLDLESSVELESVMQERQARAEGLPTGLGARVVLAGNLAGVIAALHRQGHYVVDLKPVNLRFYRRSLHVTMLDCDGCSVLGKGERFRAPQFTPEYLAPELHGRSITEADEEPQDRFALAVVVFQLLNFGIHPFTGRPASDRLPTDIPGRIAKHCYAYGVRPNPSMAPSPASGHALMPDDLRAMFDRAFEGTGSTRPSAAEWAPVLREYGQRSTGKIVTCRANRQHEHFAGMGCAACARGRLLEQAARAAQQKSPKRLRDGRPRTGGAGATQTMGAAGASSSARSASTMGWPMKLLFAVSTITALIWFAANRGCWRRDETASESHRKVIWSAPSLSSTHVTLLTLELDVMLARADGTSPGPLLAQLDWRTKPEWEDDTKATCEAARRWWLAKTAWIADDPFFLEDKPLLLARMAGIPLDEGASEHISSARIHGPCDQLHRQRSAILRIQELCRIVLASSVGYPGVGQAACREHDIIRAGIEVFEQELIGGEASNALVWESLAQAFLLADDNVRAERAFVVVELLYRKKPFALPWRSVSLEEPWLSERAAILSAKAKARVFGWYGDDLPQEDATKMNAPWPHEPAPDKPAVPDQEPVQARHRPQPRAR
jgi:hypothetical protein